MKRKYCIVLAVILAGMILVGGCIYAIVTTFGKKKPELTVYMPDGAPALAFAKLMHEDTEEDGVTYYVTNATQIASKVSYTDMDKNADLCVLPLTAATAKLGTGENYQMVGAVTHGNLYMISKDTTTTYTTGNLSSLKGKTIGVLQLGSTPGLIFKSMLSKNQIPFNVLTDGGEPATDKVNLTPVVIPAGTPAGQVLNGMISQGVDLFVMAEPAVTALQKGGFQTVGDVQTLYGEQGYTQAVIVAKKSVIEDRKAWLNDFLQDLQESAVWATTVDGATLVSAVQSHFEDTTATTTLTANTLNGAVVTRSGVRFETTNVCKTKTVDFLTVAKRVDDKTVIPSDSFYWHE